MPEDSKNIVNQDVQETLRFDEHNIKSGRLKIEVEAYPLHENDFETLVESGKGATDWAIRFLLIAIGSIIIFIAKVIQFIVAFNAAENKNNVTLQVQKYEWISILISIVLFIILIICLLYTSDAADE